MPYSTDEAQRRLAWLWANAAAPVCKWCLSVYTYAYVNSRHGYGCTDCGKDFGVVVPFKEKV